MIVIIIDNKFNEFILETVVSTTSVGVSTSTSTSSKRKRDDSIQQEVRKQKVELNNWWKVTNCVTEKASCSGTTETGFVVTPSFPNCDVRTGSEINGEGNIIYILGNHSQDGDQIEDNFGPWPKKMSSLNAVHLQFRSLQSESITEFSNRLGMSVGGTRLDHLSSSMLLFNTLKLINAIEVKKTLRKAVEVIYLLIFFLFKIDKKKIGITWTRCSFISRKFDYIT